MEWLNSDIVKMSYFRPPTKYDIILGAERGICAFGGAPRLTIINCQVCGKQDRCPANRPQTDCLSAIVSTLKSPSGFGNNKKKTR